MTSRARRWPGGREASQAWNCCNAEWDPAAEDLDAAGLLEPAEAVLRAKAGAAEAVQGNRITAGRLQLRLGRDLRWYPYVRSGQDWEPGGSPDADPALAVADL